MKVLGFDTETTGVDINTASIIEIGAVMFDVEGGVWTPEVGMSQLIFEPSYLPLPEDAMAKNGITEAMLKADGIPFKDAIMKLQDFGLGAKYFCAHKADFDRGILRSQLLRYSLQSYLADIPFICSMANVESHVSRNSRQLGHLALDYGVAVDPAQLHRAMDDVMLMGKMLSAAKANPEDMYAFNTLPTLILTTDTVPPWEDGGKDKDAAKKVGYSWEKIRGVAALEKKEWPKRWVKAIKKTQANLDAQTRAYRILEEI